MPDDRLFHKRLGHGVKVNALTDFEDIVWRTYVLTADDFGVMRFLALPLLDAFDRLAKRGRAVQRALERIKDVGLIRTFLHQESVYCYQHDWQDFQKVEYPRTSILPKPPDDALTDCTYPTRYLFGFHPGGCRVPSLKKLYGTDSGTDSGNDSGSHSGTDSGNHSGNSRARSRARSRALMANANGSGLEALGGAGGDNRLLLSRPPNELQARAERFCARYAELYAEHRLGARYHNKPDLDLTEAVGLVTAWDDARLEQLIVAFLTTDEPFCRNGSGTIPQFRSRASWCDTKLREAGL